MADTLIPDPVRDARAQYRLNRYGRRGIGSTPIQRALESDAPGSGLRGTHLSDQEWNSIFRNTNAGQIDPYQTPGQVQPAQPSQTTSPSSPSMAPVPAPMPSTPPPASTPSQLGVNPYEDVGATNQMSRDIGFQTRKSFSGGYEAQDPTTGKFVPFTPTGQQSANAAFYGAAMKMYGKPYADLAPEERANVLRGTPPATKPAEQEKAAEPMPAQVPDANTRYATKKPMVDPYA